MEEAQTAISALSICALSICAVEVCVGVQEDILCVEQTEHCSAIVHCRHSCGHKETQEEKTQRRMQDSLIKQTLCECNGD